ncbi:MAG: DUF996 domain-containing protein [Candidatus Methanomethylicus sp.]|nr:DUF996 domain-containing protein [Candidatus Methanomethylicus sp.]
MDFDTSKNLSSIGALLILLSPIIPLVLPFAGSLVGLLGFILLLLGVKGLADYYGEPGIFSNMLYGTVTGIVGILAALAVFVGVALSSLSGFLHKLFPGWNGDWTTLPSLTPNANNIGFGDIAPFIGAALAVLVILFAFALIATLLYRRSLNSLSKRSGVGLFGTAGILLLIGAVLAIILIGYLLIWFGILLLAIAFFGLKPQTTNPIPAAQVPMQSPPPPPPP